MQQCTMVQQMERARRVRSGEGQALARSLQLAPAACVKVFVCWQGVTFRRLPSVL